ncbi:hypothetical protein [Actinoallomurus iriomotensis]|uniref:FtsK domain-containing protein n=1 Tax=Actinoallomurus iriomotensis TaxID=478107 RepID=A0A9W6RUH1_9ACTN|nr:hypothetical protein [Actinoallomurus iriomotensis]GLY82054.1 hypothetical protein Airi01_103210 [Actinoallomurus iriomotensis]
MAQRVRITNGEPAIVTLFRFSGRFLSGRPLDGEPRSNSTFLRPGTEAMQKHRERPTWWAGLPGWKRAAWRMGVSVPAVTTPIGYFMAPVATAVADGTLISGATTYGGWKTYRAIRGRKHRKQWVEPLAATLGPVIKVPPTMRATDFVTVPEDFATNEDAEIVVRVPVAYNQFDTGSRQRVSEIISAKLALEDLNVSWYLAGSEPYMVAQRAPRPPDKVTFAQARQMLDSAPDSAPVLGVGVRNRVVSVDLDAESPHILISAGSGGGKSVLVRSIVAQGLRRGAFAVICDVKRVSHSWARGLPSVEYHRTPELIHHAIIKLAAEGDRRYDVIDERGEDADVGPRIFLVLEELNATMARLQKWWQANKPQGAPRQSPAVDALGDVLFMGRAAKIHCIAIGQMMTAKATGGPEIRENFATRILARYSRNAWKMLVPEVWPAPKSSRHAGRVQVVLAGTAHEAQAVFMTNEEARTYATTGLPVATPVSASHPSHGQRLSPETVPTRPTTGDPATTVPLRLVHSDNSPQQNPPVGLRMAIDLYIPDVSLAVVRKARTRDPEFPKPVAQERNGEKLYDPQDLIRWAQNRIRSTG